MARPAQEKAVKPRGRNQARLWSDPAWEAMKATRRNLSPDAAARECEYLSNQYRRMWAAMPDIQVDLDQILRTLLAKKIPFVLTGQYGIASWTGRPRATHDVDILVKTGRNYARAVKAMRELYPQLEARTFVGVAGFFPPGETESLIDVTYPHRDDNIVTLETAIWVKERGLRYRIPTLEAALANKYGAMLTPNRAGAKRLIDAADFDNMVRHSMDEGRQPINLEHLAELGEKVWPGGGGAEILGLVEQSKAGQPPNIFALVRAR
jgi:hypothetical protein